MKSPLSELYAWNDESETKTTFLGQKLRTSQNQHSRLGKSTQVMKFEADKKYGIRAVLAIHIPSN